MNRPPFIIIVSEYNDALSIPEIPRLQSGLTFTWRDADCSLPGEAPDQENVMTVRSAVSTDLFVIALLLTSLSLTAQEQPSVPLPEPAFAGQTQATAPAKKSTYKVETIVQGLNNPWSLAFLPDGNMLVSMARGSLHIVRPDGVYFAPISGMPDVKSVAAEGLHDVAIDPDFSNNRIIYFTYFAPPKGETPGVWPIDYFYDRVVSKPLAERRTMQIGHERLARARLSEDYRSLEDVEVLLEGVNRRIVPAADGKLFITGADRFRFYESDVDGPDGPILDPAIRRIYSGRVARINTDGSIPAENPFLTDPTVPPETWSIGHRDPEGAAIHPQTGELWLTEHGPQGGDEINIIRPGRDYGWPVISYGRQYSGTPVGSGKTAQEGMEQPIYYWNPSVATSGMLFYTGKLFPGWRGNLFIGAMSPTQGRFLMRLVIEGERVIAEEHLLTELDKPRVRDIRQGPDGAIYVVTGEANGKILKLAPATE
jgi:glucose/arabinose dehydrogenase